MCMMSRFLQICGIVVYNGDDNILNQQRHKLLFKKFFPKTQLCKPMSKAQRLHCIESHNVYLIQNYV